MVVRRAATKSAVAFGQSWWNSCSSGSRRRSRSRFCPGRRRGRERRPSDWRPGRRTRAPRRTRGSEGGRAARARAPVRARAACGAALWGVPRRGRADTSVRCRRVAGRVRVIRGPAVRVLVTAPFQTQVVVGTDSGEQGDFLPAQAGHAAVAAGRDPCLGRGDQLTSGAEVAAEPVAGFVLHSDTVMRCVDSVGDSVGALTGPGKTGELPSPTESGKAYGTTVRRGQRTSPCAPRGCTPSRPGLKGRTRGSLQPHRSHRRRNLGHRARAGLPVRRCGQRRGRRRPQSESALGTRRRRLGHIRCGCHRQFFGRVPA